MVSRTEIIKCAVCDYACEFDPGDLNKPYAVKACKACRFPVVYLNQNTSKGPSFSEYDQYRKHVEKWAKHHWGQIKVLSSQSGGQQVRSDKASHSSKNASVQKEEDSLIPARVGSEVMQALKAHNLAIGKLEKTVEAIHSRVVELEQQSKHSTASNSSKKNVQNLRDNPNDLATQDETFQKESSIEISPEQSRATAWISVYNSDDSESFVRRSHAKRAGATKQTMEENRLAQNGEVIIEVGNGNYWLFTPEHQNVGCLVPNRKMLRLNPNTVASLKIFFELTHDKTLRDLHFDSDYADMSTVELIYPAILDATSTATQWKMRNKGVLLFPSAHHDS